MPGAFQQALTTVFGEERSKHSAFALGREERAQDATWNCIHSF